MDRTQFTFYASFYKAIARMKKKADQAEAYNAIARLALFGEMPDLDKMSDIVAATLENVIPNILASNRKAENGKLGGSKTESNRKQNESKPKAKPKQKASEKENEIEIEIEKEIENECYNPLTPFEGELKQTVADWLAYKKEKRQPYKPTGLKSLVTQIRKAADKYGDEAVIGVIRDSMGSNYQGIMFDRLKKQPRSRYAGIQDYLTQIRGDENDTGRSIGLPCADGDALELL